MLAWSWLAIICMSKLKLISFIPYRQVTGKISLCPMCSELLYEMLQQVILPVECPACRLMLGKSKEDEKSAELWKHWLCMGSERGREWWGNWSNCEGVARALTDPGMHETLGVDTRKLLQERALRIFIYHY